MDKPLSNRKQQDFLCADTFGMSKQDSPEHLSPSCLLSLGSAQDRPATIGIIHKLLAKPVAQGLGRALCPSSFILISNLDHLNAWMGREARGGGLIPALLPGFRAAGGAHSIFALDLSTAGKAAPTAFNNHSFNTARCRK